MKGFEFADSTGLDSTLFFGWATGEAPSDAPGRIHLKCPRCLGETALDRRVAIDESLRCDSCGASHEVRQLHEAWCLSRRPMLGVGAHASIDA